MEYIFLICGVMNIFKFPIYCIKATNCALDLGASILPILLSMQPTTAYQSIFSLLVFGRLGGLKEDEILKGR